MPDADLALPQLLLDDSRIAYGDRVSRVWHQARKYPEPVLRGDQPWEYNSPVAYGTVLEWRGKLRLWYCAWSKLRPPCACHAESDDGIHWEKPRLDLHEIDGSRDNNVVLVSRGADHLIDDLTVIDDPDDPEWPLKMLYWDSFRTAEEPYGIYAARSRDGLRWETIGKVLPGWGDRFNALTHKLNGDFCLFGRAPARTGRFGKPRSAWLSRSPDLRTWSPPECVMQSDTEDPPNREVYSLAPFAYAGLLFGTIERMQMNPDVLDPELAWSRDGGRTWQRSRPRPAFIPLGDTGHFDSHWVAPTANGPLLRHGQLWFYYSGRTSAHNSPFPHNHGGIGLATLRRDGFCSLHAADCPGTLLTTPMVWPGGDLLVNVDTRRDLLSHPHFCTGEMQVEVLDAERQPIPGYGAADSLPRSVNTRDRDATVTWGDGRSLAALAGQPIHLLFRLRDAHLYAFRAGPAAPNS